MVEDALPAEDVAAISTDVVVLFAPLIHAIPYRTLFTPSGTFSSFWFTLPECAPPALKPMLLLSVALVHLNEMAMVAPSSAVFGSHDISAAGIVPPPPSRTHCQTGQAGLVGSAEVVVMRHDPPEHELSSGFGGNVPHCPVPVPPVPPPLEGEHGTGGCGGYVL